MCIRDSYVYQKGVCFFIHESYIRSFRRYCFFRNYSAVPVQLEIIIIAIVIVVIVVVLDLIALIVTGDSKVSARRSFLCFFLTGICYARICDPLADLKSAAVSTFNIYTTTHTGKAALLKSQCEWDSSSATVCMGVAST
jgi:hypothetical protein